MRREAHEVVLRLRNLLRDTIGTDGEKAVVGGQVEAIGIARIYSDTVKVGFAGEVRNGRLRDGDRAANNDRHGDPRGGAQQGTRENPPLSHRTDEGRIGKKSGSKDRAR